MTELEKLFSGMNYNALDPEIGQWERKVADICYEYNHLKPSDPRRKEMLQNLFGSYNPYISIASDFRCVYGKNIHFKGYAFINYNCTMMDSNIITIGNLVLIGPGSSLICTNHAIIKEERRAGLFNNKPITIEDYVWLGANVTVCPGVTIGEGSIIGAGSVVTKNIPANVIAAGNPCKVIRPITDSDRLATASI